MPARYVGRLKRLLASSPSPPRPGSLASWGLAPETSTLDDWRVRNRTNATRPIVTGSAVFQVRTSRAREQANRMQVAVTTHTYAEPSTRDDTAISAETLASAPATHILHDLPPVRNARRNT